MSDLKQFLDAILADPVFDDPGVLATAFVIGSRYADGDGKPARMPRAEVLSEHSGRSRAQTVADLDFLFSRRFILRSGSGHFRLAAQYFSRSSMAEKIMAEPSTAGTTGADLLEWLHRLALDKRLDGDSIRIAVALVGARYDTGTGSISVTVESLADELRLPLAQVERGLASIVMADHLTHRPGICGEPDTYWIRNGQ